MVVLRPEDMVVLKPKDMVVLRPEDMVVLRPKDMVVLRPEEMVVLRPKDMIRWIFVWFIIDLPSPPSLITDRNSYASQFFLLIYYRN